MNNLIVALMIVGMAGGTLAAQSSPNGGEFEGKTVASIRFDPPEQPLSAFDLQRVQQLKLGGPYSSGAVGETIERMFRTGTYSDIRVDVESTPSGLVITYLTKPVVFVGHVDVKGKISDPPNKSALLSSGNIALGDAFDEASIPEAEQRIKELFTSNGLYEAKVHIDKEFNGNAQLVAITIGVTPGKRARYEMPDIHGETKLPESTILRATGWRVILIHRWKRVTQAATYSGVTGVKKKYQSKDRLAATVDLEKVDYDPATRRVKPTLEIKAGPKIEVKAVECEGAQRPSETLCSDLRGRRLRQ